MFSVKNKASSYKRPLASRNCDHTYQQRTISLASVSGRGTVIIEVRGRKESPPPKIPDTALIYVGPTVD